MPGDIHLDYISSLLCTNYGRHKLSYMKASLMVRNGRKKEEKNRAARVTCTAHGGCPVGIGETMGGCLMRPGASFLYATTGLRENLIFF